MAATHTKTSMNERWKCDDKKTQTGFHLTSKLLKGKRCVRYLSGVGHVRREVPVSMACSWKSVVKCRIAFSFGLRSQLWSATCLHPPNDFKRKWRRIETKIIKVAD